MKTKVFRIGKRSISVLLSVLMVVSMMLVGIMPVNSATMDTDSVGAINYWFVSGDFNSWVTSANDTNKLVDNKVTIDMNDKLNQEIQFKMVAVEGGNQWCGISGSSAISSGSKTELSWNSGNEIKFTPTQRYVTFTISVENSKNYVTVTESSGSGGSTPTTSNYTLYDRSNNSKGAFVVSSNGVYTLDVYLNAGTTQFYIKDTSGTYYRNGSGTITTSGGSVTLYKYTNNVDNDVISVNAPSAGTYTFKWTYTSGANDGTLSVTFPSGGGGGGTPTGIYYSSDLTSGTSSVSWSQVTSAAINTTLSAGQKYTFALSDSNNFNPEFANYTWDDSKSDYCSFETSSVTVGEDTITTYVIKPNTGCKNPKIYIDTANKTIYAIATYEQTLTNTENSSETVTYYFAEESDNTTWSNSGAGVSIYYWNNSTGNGASTDVTTPAKPTGATSNEIYVYPNELYSTSGSGKHSFYVYKADLPVWATSFVFLTKVGGSRIHTQSNVAVDKDYGSIALNPNRIYLLYSNNNTNYTKGVVLDEQLWSSSNTTNVPGTKKFKANLVNYNDDRGTLNSALSSYYSTNSYSQALYVGDFNYYDSGSISSLSHFKLWNNLAQRKNDDAKAYHAAVWGLTGSKLSYSNARSITEFGQLTGPDNTTLMPLFDYNGTLQNSNIAGSSNVYTNLNFPFYESDFNGVTTYSYDSITDKNRLYKNGDFIIQPDSEKNGYETGQDTDNLQYTGFFPFYGNENRVANCGYGTEFQIEFYMTDNGVLYDNDGNAQDIAFNFSGDDDVWVYVDGIRVLDLGGTHKISAGSINFSDMKVYYKSAAKNTTEISSVGEDYPFNSGNVNVVDLQVLLEANGVNFDNSDPKTKHTLQMFYMERGLYQSNCSISFNLPQNSGLLVNSEITTVNVQDVFKNDTLIAANKDYFRYSIANKAPNSTELNAIKNSYGSTITGASTLNQSFIVFDSPVYPFKNVINRVFYDDTYSLSVSNDSTQNGSYDYITNQTQAGDGYIYLTGVNFTLNDRYSKVVSNNTKQPGITGRTGSNETFNLNKSSGTFNLLFDQSANFDNKITPNSLLRITQLDSIDSVNKTSPITSLGASGRLVSNYYTTTYTIVDNHNTQNPIMNANTPMKNSSGIIAKDKTTNNSFMLANYTDATDNNVNMTVTFNNSVEVGAIKIQKELVDADPGIKDKFFFEVTFSNIFGVSSDAKTYNFEYDVYESNGNLAENGANRKYNNGVQLYAGQYALIKGVPVGTKYTVTERARVGYSIDHVNTYVETLGTSVNPAAPSFNNGVLSGTISTVNDVTSQALSAGYVSVSESIFYNIQKLIDVTFKYFDRKIVNGQPANIDTEPTSYKVSYKSYPTEVVKTTDEGEVTELYLDKLIAHAAVEFDAVHNITNINNVIDEYKMWTTQQAAHLEMQWTRRVNGNWYGSEYGQYRTDCYGNTYFDENGNCEKWITYYDANGNELLGEEQQGNYNTPHSDVSSITVWLYNSPKQYRVQINTAESISDISKQDNGRYVAGTNNKFDVTSFYNMRFGEESLASGSQNAISEHLKAYGLTDGYLGDYPKTASSFDMNNDSKDDLVFLGWAIDPEGKYIVSNQMNYEYRITTDLTLYAVYETPNSNAVKEPGLTVYENDSDIFVVEDKNGNDISKTRLNLQLNPYNCPMSDSNIDQVSAVYVILTGAAREYDFTDDQINDMRDEIQELLSNTSGNTVSGKITVVTVDKNANGFIYDVVDSPEDIADTSYDVTLTSRNRIQISTTFTTSKLTGFRLLAFGAMNYAGKGWIVSDNFADFDYYNSAP